MRFQYRHIDIPEVEAVWGFHAYVCEHEKNRPNVKLPSSATMALAGCQFKAAIRKCLKCHQFGGIVLGLSLW